MEERRIEQLVHSTCGEVWGSDSLTTQEKRLICAIIMAMPSLHEFESASDIFIEWKSQLVERLASDVAMNRDPSKLCGVEVMRHVLFGRRQSHVSSSEGSGGGAESSTVAVTISSAGDEQEGKNSKKRTQRKNVGVKRTRSGSSRKHPRGGLWWGGPQQQQQTQQNSDPEKTHLTEKGDEVSPQ